MSRVRDCALAAASGVLAALCLPRPGLCALGWIAFAPLIAAASENRPRRSLGLGFLAGFAFHGVALHWVYDTCRFAGVAPAVGALAWSALACFLALHWTLAAGAGSWLSRRLPAWLRPWAWAAVWTALLVVWERWTPRLCIDLPEYTQWRHLALLQIAAPFGPHGLGFLIVAANAALAQAWLEAPEPAAACAANLAAACALILAAWAWGARCLALRAPGPAAAVEILQPDVDQYQKFDEAFEESIRGNFIELLSRPRAEKPYLVVWPESSLPYLVEEGKPAGEAARWSKTLDAFQLVGVVSTDHARTYNSAFLLGADGALKAVYHKRELVPFGEYVPFAFLRRYIGILDQMGGISAGEPRQPLMETPLGLAAASVCYEAMFPRWANLDAGRGARLIVNITNDGWYKDTWGPYQHFQANVFRAIENRVSVVRAGNTGISAVIDPWGVITARLELDARGRLDASVPRDDAFPERSFYARHGDWFGTLCLACAALLWLLALRRRAV